MANLKPTKLTPVTHELKVWPEYFKAIIEGEKDFEVRKYDRRFFEEDFLLLKEWRPGRGDAEGAYTGREVLKQIKYILHGGHFGIEEGYCVLGLEQPITELVEEAKTRIEILGKRPDLSHLTNGEVMLDDIDGFVLLRDKWVESEENQKSLKMAVKSIPQLIQFAEMLHDKLASNPNAIEFTAVNAFLNSLKPE